jgi:Spy/CpxP family protein refolding chaperone
MNNTKVLDAKVMTFSTVAAILGATFAIAMSTSAAAPEYPANVGGLRGECTAEHHEEIEQALENGDYASWKELRGDRGRISQVVTEQNFSTFVAMHEAMEAGDTAKANELRAELGLPEHGKGMMRGNGRGIGAHRVTE